MQVQKDVASRIIVAPRNEGGAQRRFRNERTISESSPFFFFASGKKYSLARAESLTQRACDTKRARDKNTPAYAESYARRPGSGGARVYFRPLLWKKKSGSGSYFSREKRLIVYELGSAHSFDIIY